MKALEILARLTLSGSALALLLMALRYFFLKRMPSTVYYYAWLLVLLRFVLPLPGLIPLGSAASEPAPAQAAAVSVPIPDESLSPRQEQPVAVGQTGGEAARSTAIEAAEAPPPQQSLPTAKAVRSVNWSSPVLWIALWGTGAVLCFGYTGFSYLRFVKGLRKALKSPDARVRALYASLPGRKPSLYSCRFLKTPLMCGILHPRIILPERSFDAEMLSNILQHELMHYRRRDTLYKWAAAAVLSLHWFNPLAWLIRREMNRACELSCDELLLRSMNREEKQAYGNTLLNMAASSSLPAGVVATTFSTEKKNLKERLEQIMNYKRNGARLLASVLALVLLAGCGVAAGPAAAVETEAAPTEENNVVRVSTVDELLAAIAPDTVIELASGTYDLSTASDYNKESNNPWYVWSSVYPDNNTPGAELELRQVRNLTLRGAGKGETVIAAVPRYANVMKFVGCQDIRLESLTAGHTIEPGFCAGGVLRLETCTRISVENCGLYGCGTIGVDAQDTVDLTIRDSDIYECSYGAVYASRCRNVLVDHSEIYDHGNRAGEGSSINLFDSSYSEGFTVYNCSIHNNSMQYLLHCDYTKNARFLSNEVRDNTLDASMFAFTQYGATVDGCVFADNGGRGGRYYGGTLANDVEGNQLDGSALAKMTLRDVGADVAVKPVKVEAPTEVSSGGYIAVSTVDELLSAIGPDRTIVLEGELFDLSTAANYGSVGGEYYFWQESYDGPELVIHDVSGLTISSESDDPAATTLAAIPRYANVLNLRDCSNIMLVGFTMGHTKEPGSCSGGVLNLQNCGDITVDSMRLYGCGVLGIQTAQCYTLNILRSELYECSQGAASFFQTDGIRFAECNVHDVPSPALTFYECGDVTWDNEPVNTAYDYDVSAEGALTEVRNQGEEVYAGGGIENLVNPFAEEPAFFYPAGSAQALFAASVQQAIADEDWESLAEKASFPLQVFSDGENYLIRDQEELIEGMSSIFTERMRQRFADASLEEYGGCVFGTTCCDHLIAFACIGDPASESSYRVSAISLDLPLWPGRSMYIQVTP